MQPLFSTAGKRRLDQVVQPGLLCVFDFDGTLAPIVAHPPDARLPAEVLNRLLRLSQLVPLGVLTGRSLRDVRERLGFTPRFLVGNHGMEGLPDCEEDDAAEHEAEVRGWVAQLLPQLDVDPGLLLEDKGRSLSLHYRKAANPEAALAMLQDAVMRLEPPPRVIAGKQVLNLLPANALDKGAAMLQLMKASGCTTAIYVGDDVTDEDAFRLREPGLLTVRIEPHDQSAAEFYLPHWSDIVHLLDHLLERLCADTVLPSAPSLPARS